MVMVTLLTQQRQEKNVTVQFQILWNNLFISQDNTMIPPSKRLCLKLRENLMQCKSTSPLPPYQKKFLQIYYGI